MSRAKVGGQIGMNGEFYQGGQFLPNSKTTVKGMSETARTGKKYQTRHNIAFRQFTTERPTETAQPIYSTICGTYAARVDGSEDKLERYEPFIKYAISNGWKEMVKGYHINELIEMFNSGERWFEPR